MELPRPRVPRYHGCFALEDPYKPPPLPFPGFIFEAPAKVLQLARGVNIWNVLPRGHGHMGLLGGQPAGYLGCWGVGEDSPEADSRKWGC